MDKIYKIQTGQNIFDLSLQLFGSIQNVYDIIDDNQLEDVGTLPVPGTEIVYTPDGYGNELMKKEIRTKGYVFANGQDAGSYNNNFNPDFD